MKSKTTAYLLLIFFGGIGLHKFYLNQYLMGIIYILTFGLFGIGIIIDLFTLSSNVDLYNKLISTYTNRLNTIFRLKDEGKISQEECDLRVKLLLDI